MKATWDERKLSEVARIEGGGTPKRTHPEYFGGDIPWITPTDLDAIGTICRKIQARETISEVGLKASSAKLVPAGSVLFSSRATIGKIAITDMPCATNQGFANFVPDQSVINTEYLAYALSGKRSEITKLAGKTTFLEVPRGRLKEFRIPVPPLEEQRRIVARIKECMERVEEIERLRSAANAEREALFESTIEAALAEANGKEVLLEEVSSIEVPLVDPRSEDNMNKLHVGGANIESGTGSLLDLKTSKDEELKSIKFPFNSSMVLYNKIRPYLKKVARPDFEGICSADMYPLTPRPDLLLRDYLFFLLLSRDFTQYAINGSNRAAMPKVNRKHLFAYKFKLPGLGQQQAIIDELNEAFAAISTLRQTISEGVQEENHLRDAILRKAFSGEL